MVKTITDNQLIGEIGEAAVRTRFLSIGFQFDQRSRLETGIDGIAEVMHEGEPTARMIAVQIKSTRGQKYTSENDSGFTYLVRSADIDYWRPSNLPVILVLYRDDDQSFFWKEIKLGAGEASRKLHFKKSEDRLDKDAVDRLAQLTVPKQGLGYYVPPLRGGEKALVNMLPVGLPQEMYVASTPYGQRRAVAELYKETDYPRFDWVIKDGTLWSFHDPRNEMTAAIVDEDQVDAIDTRQLAFHDDLDEQNNFAFLLKSVLRHQTATDLAWDKERRLLYFQAIEEGASRPFAYFATQKNAETMVVNAIRQKKDPHDLSYVRHHAFIPRFERMMDEWFLMVSPTYHFTTNGFQRHSYPHALLSGKKRLDNNASLRGQVIMWHRYLSDGFKVETDLFNDAVATADKYLQFAPPPEIELPTTVPEDAWVKPKAPQDAETDEEDAFPQAAFELQ
ncbi:DUF4365 domain-containing protein [Qipengyuania pacifica]|uniref:DUF4365 domain-containing protein n=1 Tax=Qipengyuania pacifica TaxID=2860199 RepID=UPI0035C86AC8